jgi:hypothetical protein
MWFNFLNLIGFLLEMQMIVFDGAMERMCVPYIVNYWKSGDVCYRLGGSFNGQSDIDVPV